MRRFQSDQPNEGRLWPAAAARECGNQAFNRGVGRALDLPQVNFANHSASGTIEREPRPARCNGTAGSNCPARPIAADYLSRSGAWHHAVRPGRLPPIERRKYFRSCTLLRCKTVEQAVAAGGDEVGLAAAPRSMCRVPRTGELRLTASPWPEPLSCWYRGH